MKKIDRKAFWQDFWEEYRSVMPTWYQILMFILGLSLIVLGIVLRIINGSWSQGVILALLIILFLVEYPFLVIWETKKEYAKPKKKK